MAVLRRGRFKAMLIFINFKLPACRLFADLQLCVLFSIAGICWKRAEVVILKSLTHRRLTRRTSDEGRSQGLLIKTLWPS